MFKQEYGDLPESNVGVVEIGEVHLNKVHLNVSFQSLAFQRLFVVVFYLEGSCQAYPVDLPSVAGVTINWIQEFDTSRVVKQIAVVVDEDGEFARLGQNPETSFLDRLLSVNLKQVNANLRWVGRIPHLETRFFCALNSIKATPGNFDLHCRCLVSVGYQALERGNGSIIEWSEDFCQSCSHELASTKDVEIRASVLMLWIHLAVWQQNVSDIRYIGENLGRFLEGIESYPVGSYNAVRISLLIGSIYLFAGDCELAVKIFSPADKIFRLAVDKYPRGLVNYRELVSISDRLFYCQIGLEMAKGSAWKVNIDPLTPQMAWNKGARFYDKDAMIAGRKRYVELVSLMQRPNQ
ncbi:hypothetical protein WDB88_05980 [Thioclava sp. GXIMD4216]